MQSFSSWRSDHTSTWANTSMRLSDTCASRSRLRANAVQPWRPWPQSRTRQLSMRDRPTSRPDTNRLTMASIRPRASKNRKICQTNYWRHLVKQPTGWTPERRVRQSEAIRSWRPWLRSTGPQTPRGKARSSRNAFKGGKRAKLRADLAYFRAMLRALELEDEEAC